MPIDRSGPTPFFYEYITKSLLIPHNSTPNQQLQSASSAATFGWIEIPRYQRGISWDLEDVEEFLLSPSPLLGNVILAQFARAANQFPSLPQHHQYFNILVDGLQRLAVGTMLINVLDTLVWANNAEFSHLSSLFPYSAWILPMAPIYRHNDYEFSNHPREVISIPYRQLKERLTEYVRSKLANPSDANELASVLDKILVQCQIAVDTYFRFAGPIEVMRTFLGINTMRVDLGPFDLIRAYVIERAASSGWNSGDIDDADNRFTDVFTTNNKINKELLAFSLALLKVIENGHADKVFPSWNNSVLDKAEIDKFLDYVEAFKNVRGNGYIDEIRACGSIPFGTLLAYYYVNYVQQGSSPSFLANGKQEYPDLHRFLIACYRAVVDGRLGRFPNYIKSILEGNITQNLVDLADNISVFYVGCGASNKLDLQWLRIHLGKITKEDAKRVFNAMLLQPHSQGYGHVFIPLSFGQGQRDFHIDHLIPDRSLNRNVLGFSEAHTLCNLAPLPSVLNRSARNTPCSQKLSPGGMYESYLNNSAWTQHPYCSWLVNNHFASVQSPADLDKQELLVPNSSPPIGDMRIGYLANYLVDRI